MELVRCVVYSLVNSHLWSTPNYTARQCGPSLLSRDSMHSLHGASGAILFYQFCLSVQCRGTMSKRLDISFKLFPPSCRDITLVNRHYIKEKGKVKEADLYSAFIEVPYTQGAQVRITQCYLQITPYLPLPHKYSPDGASQTEVADI